MNRNGFALFVICASLTISTAATAGIVKENGGNSVICQKENGTGAELLDFYEATQLIPPADLHFTYWKNRPEAEALKFILQTIDIVRGPAVAEYYRSGLKKFMAEANFISGALLGTVNDSYHFLIPRNCEVVQTVLQIEPIFHEARYTIDADIWDLLPPLHQLGMKVHEMIYRDLNPDDSRTVRLITAFLFSDEIQRMDIQGQKSILIQMGFTVGTGIRNTDRRPN